MKNNKKLGIDIIIDDNNSIGGLSRSTYAGLSNTAKASGGTLTLKNLEKMMSYLQSKKYLKREAEKEKFIAIGRIIANKALSMGLITKLEFYRLSMTIDMNGGLIISKKMYDKILPAAEIIEKEMR